jgi:hypothetical protein
MSPGPSSNGMAFILLNISLLDGASTSIVLSLLASAKEVDISLSLLSGAWLLSSLCEKEEKTIWFIAFELIN